MDDRAPGASLEGSNTLGPATATPVALKDWNTLKAHLGFSVFLPTGLPVGSCLLSASGSVRNAISGSNLTLTYLLADQTSLTIAQTPQRNKQTAFQCSIMPELSYFDGISAIQRDKTPNSSVQLCTGTHGGTAITFSANWDKQKLWQFFQDLQTNENWIPHT